VAWRPEPGEPGHGVREPVEGQLRNTYAADEILIDGADTSDQHLMARLRNGDTSARQPLVARYQVPLQAYLYTGCPVGIGRRPRIACRRPSSAFCVLVPTGQPRPCSPGCTASPPTLPSTVFGRHGRAIHVTLERGRRCYARSGGIGRDPGTRLKKPSFALMPEEVDTDAPGARASQVVELETTEPTMNESKG
jgi:hypothetical protein